jgi:hypothetical protein
MPEPPISGGCNCGAVRFEVTEPFVSANYRHCRRCQRQDPGIRPQVRQFVAYAAAWEPIPDDGLPRHPESSRRAAR